MQTSLTYRSNRDLFSNHYLDEHLPETEDWEEVDNDAVRAARDEIIELWEREKDTVEERNESQLEEKFIRPMFRKLGIPFEVEESVSRGQRRPDYGFFESEDAARGAFDRRKEGGDFYEHAVAVADAKRWGRKLDTRGEHERDFENPSYQIHVYLQETPTQWAVLTNGKKWRLYYGPTSHRLDSYYEIDLPTLLESGDLDDFRYFYLFFRHEAFVEDASGDCFLDEVYSESNTFAEALGEDLQDNIYEAIRVLAEGFLDGNDHLNEDDLDLIHDSSLIYLYRLIFVLYAESEGRELLPTDNDIYSDAYSLNQLKQTVTENRDDPQDHYLAWRTDLWDRLEELFDLINEGSEAKDIPRDQLYIPAYNGGLFRTNPDEDNSIEAQFLASHEVGDAYLAEVIDLLTRREAENGAGKVFVDYSSLDIRHLGSIYEGLLEYQINIADEALALDDGEYTSADENDEIVVVEGDVYLTTGSGERKATGSYYTPEYVVEYIVENTLEPLINDIREDFLDSENYGAAFAEEFAERVFDLKILDPAMGSGHFLTNAVDYLAREIIDAQEKQAAQQGTDTVDQTHDINWARRQVAQRCIYGVDLNPLAVELAKVSLWLRTLAAEQPLAFLDHHLKTGNSLVGSDIEDVLSNGESEIEDGQLTLRQSFARTRRQALEHVMDRFQSLLSIDNESLEDVKEMEAAFEEVRDDPLYQHLLAMANVHTAEEFGLDVPSDAYERMAKALQEDSWRNIESQDWFKSAQAIAKEEYFFHWELEFPVAFYDESGHRKTDAGFDAVIGNPPYIRILNLRQTNQELVDYLGGSSKYSTTKGRYDIYAPFVERGVDLASQERVCYILPNKFFESGAGEPLREFLTENRLLSSLIDFGQHQLFSGATTYTCILSLAGENSFFNYSEVDFIPQSADEIHSASAVSFDLDEFSSESWTLTSPEKQKILDQIKYKGTALSEMSDQILQGMKSGDNDVLFPEVLDWDDLVKIRSPTNEETYLIEPDLIKPIILGKHIKRYEPPESDSGVIYPYEQRRGETDIIPESRLKNEFPRTYDYLNDFHDRLEDRRSEHMRYETWYALNRPREKSFFESEKVIVPDICERSEFTLDSEGELYIGNTGYGIVPSDNSGTVRRYILTVLNSSTTWFYIYHTSTVLENDFRRFLASYLGPLPMPELPSPEESPSDNLNLPDFFDINDIYDASYKELLAYLGDEQTRYHRERSSLNLDLLNYLGNYEEGPVLPGVGLFQPTGSRILDATTEDYEKLRVGDVKTERDGRRIIVYSTTRYKPENEDGYETDQWGYTETEYQEAFTLTDLTDEEAALVEAFVPVAVGEGDGFAGFRDNATKTTSPIDRLKTITLPDPADVMADFRHYIEVKERAEELDKKIEKTDQLIDEIVYNLYDLTDEEVEIVESTVKNN